MQHFIFLYRRCWRRNLPGCWAVSTDKGLPTFIVMQCLSPASNSPRRVLQSFRALVTMYHCARRHIPKTWIITVYLKTQFLSEVSLIPLDVSPPILSLLCTLKALMPNRCWLQQSCSDRRLRIDSTQQNAQIHFSPCTFCLTTLSVVV
jgi:hypothetical protein